jgi:hypothetical protein
MAVNLHRRRHPKAHVTHCLSGSMIANPGPVHGHHRGFQDQHEFVMFGNSHAYPAYSSRSPRRAFSTHDRYSRGAHGGTIFARGPQESGRSEILVQFGYVKRLFCPSIDSRLRMATGSFHAIALWCALGAWRISRQMSLRACTLIDSNI